MAELMAEHPDIGDLAMVEWFEQARRIVPGTPLFLNEFGIIASAENTRTTAQQQYHNTLALLLEHGTPIDGIGIQGHFRANDLTGPEALWRIFDRLAQFGLTLHITECDINIKDEQLQADYTRDLLTATFAHDAIDAFLLWGFWEAAHWRPDAALFRRDWSIKPNGQAYLDLVQNAWWTSADLVSDQTGTAAVRGFKGEYAITVSARGVSQVHRVTLSDGGLTVRISLPLN